MQEKRDGAETDFIRKRQGDQVFGKRSPDEVDEFGRRFLEMSYGLERVERWRIEKGAKS